MNNIFSIFKLEYATTITYTCLFVQDSSLVLCYVCEYLMVFHPNIVVECQPFYLWLLRVMLLWCIVYQEFYSTVLRVNGEAMVCVYVKCEGIIRIHSHLHIKHTNIQSIECLTVRPSSHHTITNCIRSIQSQANQF